MKILHIISQRPDSTGSGIYLKEVINQSNGRGFQNGLLAATTTTEEKIIIPSIPEKYVFPFSFMEELGHHIIGMSDVMPYESKTFNSLTDNEFSAYISCWKNKVSHAVHRFQPDIIHSHHLWLLSSLIKNLFPHIPVVTTCHGTDLRQYQNCPNFQDFTLSGCRKIDRIMALSSEQKGEIASLYGIPVHRIVTIGGGYNKSIFHAEQNVHSRTSRLLYAGKIARYKGVGYLLKSLAKLDSHPFHLDLAGSSSGEDFDYCMELAKTLGNKITYHGPVTQKKLAALMRRAELFLLPSFFEGLPLVLLEALATGCHILGTDLPGVREIIARTGTQRIKTLPLPEMATIDTATADGEIKFQTALDQLVESELTLLAKTPASFHNKMLGNIDYFSWNSVFDRICNCYTHVLMK